MQANTKQTQKVMAKRTAKNSVFLDLFQSKNATFTSHGARSHYNLQELFCIYWIKKNS